MNHNILALLLAVATGSAHAAADAFTDSIPAKAEGIPLAYIGKDTRAAFASLYRNYLVRCGAGKHPLRPRYHRRATG